MIAPSFTANQIRTETGLHLSGLDEVVAKLADELREDDLERLVVELVEIVRHETDGFCEFCEVWRVGF